MISNRNKMYQRGGMEENTDRFVMKLPQKFGKKSRNITVKKSNLLVVPIQSSGGKI